MSVENGLSLPAQTPEVPVYHGHSFAARATGAVLALALASTITGCGLKKGTEASSTAATKSSAAATPRATTEGVRSSTATTSKSVDPTAAPAPSLAPTGSMAPTATASPTESAKPLDPLQTEEGFRMPYVPQMFNKDGINRFFTSEFTGDFGKDKPSMSWRWYTAAFYDGEHPLLIGPGKTGDPNSPVKKGFSFDLPCGSKVKAPIQTRVVSPNEIIGGINLEYYGKNVIIEWPGLPGNDGTIRPDYFVFSGLSKVTKSFGEIVQPGEEIGRSGETGKAGNGCRLDVTAFRIGANGVKEILDLGQLDKNLSAASGKRLVHNVTLPFA